MKTPREILLQKHAPATPELDAMAAKLVRELEPKRASSSWLEVCMGWLRVPRLGWSALGAAWLVIVALNVASRETEPARHGKPASQAVLDESLREQKRLYAELIGLAVRREPPPAEQPPRPQSARRPETFFA